MIGGAQNILTLKAKRAERAERLAAWGPGARFRAPGGGPGGEAPRSFQHFVVSESKFGAKFCPKMRKKSCLYIVSFIKNMAWKVKMLAYICDLRIRFMFC